jgi:hypothetical protein
MALIYAIHRSMLMLGAQDASNSAHKTRMFYLAKLSYR